MGELEGNAVASVKAIWVKYRYHHPGWAMANAGLLLVTAGVWSLYFVFAWWAFYTRMETLPDDGSAACPSCGADVGGRPSRGGVRVFFVRQRRQGIDGVLSVLWGATSGCEGVVGCHERRRRTTGALQLVLRPRPGCHVGVATMTTRLRPA